MRAREREKEREINNREINLTKERDVNSAVVG